MHQLLPYGSTLSQSIYLFKKTKATPPILPQYLLTLHPAPIRKYNTVKCESPKWQKCWSFPVRFLLKYDISFQIHPVNHQRLSSGLNQ